MFRFLRPKLRTTVATYRLGPHYDTEGASRLIYQKQFAYPLDGQFAAGIPTARPFLVLPAPPVLVGPAALITGIAGIPTGGFYSLPISSEAFE